MNASRPTAPGLSERFLSSDCASRFLASYGCRVAPKTLAKIRCVGGGPVFRRFGRLVVYLESDLLAWAKDRISEPRQNTASNPPQTLRRNARLIAD